MAQIFPASVAGFTVYPTIYPPNTTHILYGRAHSGSKKSSTSKNALLPEGRTLFLVNIPPDATEREIILFFKGSGTIERVVMDGDAEEMEDLGADSDSDEEVDSEPEDIEDNEQPRKKRKITKDDQPTAPKVTPLPSQPLRRLRRTGHTVHIIFLDTSSISRALSTPQKLRSWPTETSTPSGLAHYTTQFSSLRPPLDVVRAHADSWMELSEYEQAQKKQKSKYRKGEAIVDEDGFTLVTRGGAYGQTVGGGVGVASKKFQNEQHGKGGGKRNRKNKKEKTEKDGFYAFQLHEKKRQELIDLKRKWEEDKAEVDKLKESRKFKPY